MIEIYHKSTCSKSCEVLSVLKKKRSDIKIIHYLETPPTKKELRLLLKKLGMKAEELVRKKEKIYQENYADKKLTNAQWIDVLVKNPILIERPIIVKGDKAIIARPTEKAEAFLKEE
jgi:arsenate reductase (glutaredoxin)